MIPRLADVAAVQATGGLDFMQGREVAGETVPDPGDLPPAAFRSGTGQDSSAVGQDGDVFHEGGIGKARLSLQNKDFESTSLQGPPVSFMLLKRPLIARLAQSCGSHPLRKVRPRPAHDRLAEHSPFHAIHSQTLFAFHRSSFGILRVNIPARKEGKPKSLSLPRTRSCISATVMSGRMTFPLAK